MPTPVMQAATGGDSPFRELLDTMNDAVAWLADCGLTFDRLRMSQYRRDLEDLIRADESASLPEVVRERMSARLANSLLEAGELRRLYRGLVFFADSPLEEKLRRLIALAGREADEHARNSTDNPRDLGLELTLAARLAACGFGLEVDDRGQFEATIGGRTVFFECTRIQGSRDAGARIRETQRRLLERCAAREGSRAIMAFGVTRLDELGLGFLSCPDPMQLTRRMEEGIDQFLGLYEHLWMKPIGSPVIGAWTYVSRPVLIGISHRLLHAQRFGLEATPGISAEDDDLLWLIDERFRFLAELTAALL